MLHKRSTCLGGYVCVSEVLVMIIYVSDASLNQQHSFDCHLLKIELNDRSRC